MSKVAAEMPPRGGDFLPETMRLFLRRRLIEAGGLALVIAGLLLAVALLSYAPQDPTLNNATAAAPRNMLGLPGAYLADIILQTTGLAGGVFVLCFLAWGWRIATHQGLPWPLLHLALLPPAVALTAAFLSAWPLPEGWPVHAGLGGVMGHVLLSFGADLLRPLGLSVSRFDLALRLLFGIPALISLLFALGISLDNWLGGARRLIAAARLIRSGLARMPYPRRKGGENPGEALPPRAQPRRSRRRAGKEKTARSPSARPRIGKQAAPPRLGKRAAAEREPQLELGGDGDPVFPPLSLLHQPGPGERVARSSIEALEQNGRMLEAVLDDFGIRGQITNLRPGPVVTLYELEPAPGTKSSRVIALADDIARSMSAISARVAVIQGRNALGIELPNSTRETVYLRELLATDAFERHNGSLTLALGKDIGGDPVFADLARMPHLLVAGTTGAGKSVAINTMILSLLYRLPAEKCRFIMIDPKMLELSVYDGIPHLLAPVVTDPAKAVSALKWVVREMEGRYRKMSELGVRNVASYNQRVAEARAAGRKLERTVQTGYDAETGEPLFETQTLDMEEMPFIVVIVDEMADLMMVAGKEIEAAIQRLAQMARAAGIHLIMATQRPSVDVITGTIKANFPTRISFQVTSKIDSRTILGEPGAEQLLGAGDMLFMPGAGRVKRVHGPFVGDEEVEQIVAFLKQTGTPDYREDITLEAEETAGGSVGGGGGEKIDPRYDEAVALVTRERKASTSFVQRHLQIGYNRAARIIEQMEAEGVISPANHVGKREVLARDIDDVES